MVAFPAVGPFGPTGFDPFAPYTENVVSPPGAPETLPARFQIVAPPPDDTYGVDCGVWIEKVVWPAAADEPLTALPWLTMVA
jgi:hypothetical protein